jgi:RNA polymerase-binding transcription factor DksA
MRHSHCAKCGEPIPKMRLEALPDTITCVACSSERAKTVLDIECDSSDPHDLQRMVATPGGER